MRSQNRTPGAVAGYSESDEWQACRVESRTCVVILCRSVAEAHALQSLASGGLGRRAKPALACAPSARARAKYERFKLTLP